MSSYDGLGTLFDLNCLRSVSYVWGFPIWRRAPGRENAKKRGLGQLPTGSQGQLRLTIRSSGDALCGAKPKTVTDGSVMDQAK
jgi:hypothetical protein